MAKQKTLFEQLKSAEHQDVVQEGASRNSIQLKIIVITISILLSGFLFPNHSVFNDGGAEGKQISIGVLWMNETIKAELPFAIERPQKELQYDLDSVSGNIPSVFTENQFAKLHADSLLTEIASIISGPAIDSNQDAKFNEIKLLNETKRDFIAESILSVKNAILDECYVHHQLVPGTLQMYDDHVLLKKSQLNEVSTTKKMLIDTQTVKKYVQDIVGKSIEEDVLIALQGIVVKTLLPAYSYSSLLTNELKQTKLASVPRTLGIVRIGDVIINKGERFDKMSYLKMKSYMKYRSITENEQYSWSILLGGIGHAFLIFSMLILYVYFIRPRIYADNKQLFGLFGIVNIAAILGWVSLQIQSDYPLEYAVFVPALSMLIAILYDSRTAFYSTVVMSLLIAGIRGSDYSVGLAMMIGGMVAAYSVRDIQSRTQIFTSIVYVFIGFALTIFSVNAERSLAFTDAYPQLIVAGINSIVSPLLTFAIVYVVERFFSVTTDLKLEEFDNLEHPLLLEMNEKAPGTFQHTMTIARLAESAATAIHANSLLAKVGAFYHDIGKIPKAEYYVENQINIDNKHDKLPPKKSAGIIKDHVLDGIELANEYKLPQRITDFIPMHHGTMLIKHFYAKALEQSNAGEGATVVKEEDYRYSGPKPRTKETAILMLADAAEAIMRINNAETKDDIEFLLQNIIHERLIDGQFDECPLTLSEIHEIKESFVKNLLGMRHHRVSYKEIPDQK